MCLGREKQWSGHAGEIGVQGEKKKEEKNHAQQPPKTKHIYFASGEIVRRLLKEAVLSPPGERSEGVRGAAELGPAAGGSSAGKMPFPGQHRGRGPGLTCRSRGAGGRRNLAKKNPKTNKTGLRGPGRRLSPAGASVVGAGGLAGAPWRGRGQGCGSGRAWPAAGCACPAAHVGLGRRVGELAPVLRAPGSSPG